MMLFVHYNTFANMEQFPAKDAPLSSMLTWLNKHITPLIPPIADLEELTDGAAFLTLLNKVRPEIIDPASICLQPSCSLEVDMNLALLASSIRKSGLTLPKAMFARPSLIGNLSERSPQYSLQLLTFLFSTYSKETPETSPVKEETDLNEKTSNLLIMPQASMVIPSSVSQESVKTITEEELIQLDQLKERIKAIEESFQSKSSVKNKIDIIASLFNENKSEISQKRLPRLTNPTNLHDQEVQYLTNKSLSQDFKNFPQDKNEIQIGKQIFAKLNSFKSAKLSNTDQNLFLKNIGFITQEILRSVTCLAEFSEEELTIIDNFSAVHSIYEAFGYLFFGNKLPEAIHRRYNFQEKSSNFKLIRNAIRGYCQRFYRSPIIIKRVLLSNSILMRMRLLMIRMLLNIELLPSRNLKKIQFLQCQYRCLETEEERLTQQQALGGTSLISSSLDIKSLEMTLDTSEDPIKETQDKNMKEESSQCQDNDVVSTEKKPIPLFWSEHMIVLIAYEAKHVYNKKPDFQQQYDYQKFINSKAHERYQFDGGFLFPGKKNRMSIDYFKIITESDKFPYLKALFDTSSEQSSMSRLREFIRIMLELKHHSIVKHFIEIYDLIVGELKQTTFESVKRPSDRFGFVESVVKRAAKGVTKINDYFTNTYDLRDDHGEIEKLLKVTVYCFLAELHCFRDNEFYPEAFDFPKVDKKISTNKIFYEKSTGKKIQSQPMI